MPKQPHKLQPTFFSAYKICLGISGTDVVGVANQRLVQFETHAHKRESTPDTACKARKLRLNSSETQY